MTALTDAQYLQQALAVAAPYQGQCAPNPPVGAIVVKENNILSEGAHQGAGQPHAERVALTRLTKAQAQGATVYVTLEPCCHHGRTPPCTELLIDYGIKRVVYGLRDPNPQVAGNGVAQLQAHHITCDYLALDDIHTFYRSYCFWQQHQRPWITAKLALSLDGKIAGVQGKRMQISGEAANVFTHQHRAKADAILTTARTVLQDDPKLTVRLPQQSERTKPLYILDRTCRLACQSQLAITKLLRRITLFHDQQCTPPADNPHQFHYVPIPTTQTQLDWLTICRVLGEHGLHQVWVEAGGRCFQSLLIQQLLNEAYLYINPCVLGANHYDAFLQPAILVKNAKQVSWKQAQEDGICHIIWAEPRK